MTWHQPGVVSQQFSPNFNLLVGTVVDQDFRHFMKNQGFDFVKDIIHKALSAFAWEQCQLVLIQTESTGSIESASESFDWFLGLAKFDCRSAWLEQVSLVIGCGHGWSQVCLCLRCTQMCES